MIKIERRDNALLVSLAATATAVLVTKLACKRLSESRALLAGTVSCFAALGAGSALFDRLRPSGQIWLGEGTVDLPKLQGGPKEAQSLKDYNNRMSDLCGADILRTQYQKSYRTELSKRPKVDFGDFKVPDRVMTDIYRSNWRIGKSTILIKDSRDLKQDRIIAALRRVTPKGKGDDGVNDALGLCSQGMLRCALDAITDLCADQQSTFVMEDTSRFAYHVSKDGDKLVYRATSSVHATYGKPYDLVGPTWQPRWSIQIEAIYVQGEDSCRVLLHKPRYRWW